MNYLDGLKYAEDHGYQVKEYPSPFKAFSIRVGSLYGIAVNHEKLAPGEETTALFHELGHCATDSFYTEDSPHAIRQRLENHADKWAIQMLVPEKAFRQAVSDGHTDLWDLADIFDVTESFMRKAVCWYTHRNLNPDLYL